ncbi:hypothetical protein WA158_005040 [Blastocystis sp. Blastoise]
MSTNNNYPLYPLPSSVSTVQSTSTNNQPILTYSAPTNSYSTQNSTNTINPITNPYNYDTTTNTYASSLNTPIPTQLTQSFIQPQQSSTQNLVNSYPISYNQTLYPPNSSAYTNMQPPPLPPQPPKQPNIPITNSITKTNSIYPQSISNNSYTSPTSTINIPLPLTMVPPPPVLSSLPALPNQSQHSLSTLPLPIASSSFSLPPLPSPSIPPLSSSLYPLPLPPPPSLLLSSNPLLNSIYINKPIQHEVIDAWNLFHPPGRYSRPKYICIILRGIPGSGKSYVAQRLKEVEDYYASQNNISIPTIKILSMDTIIEEISGEKRKRSETWDMDYELKNRDNMVEFVSRVCGRKIPVVIIDNMNLKASDYTIYSQIAVSKGYTVYLLEMKTDLKKCTTQNIHGYSAPSLCKLVTLLEKSDPSYPLLDYSTILQFPAKSESPVSSSLPSKETTSIAPASSLSTSSTNINVTNNNKNSIPSSSSSSLSTISTNSSGTRATNKKLITKENTTHKKIVSSSISIQNTKKSKWEDSSDEE